VEVLVKSTRLARDCADCLVDRDRDSERRESTAAVSTGKRVADTMGEGLAQSFRTAISTCAEALEPRHCGARHAGGGARTVSLLPGRQKVLLTPVRDAPRWAGWARRGMDQDAPL